MSTTTGAVTRSTPHGSAAAPPAPRRPRARYRLAPWALLAPALLLFLGFLLIPILYSVWLSVRGLRLEGGGPFGRRVETFVGLENYVSAVQDAEFLAGFGRLLVYGLIAVPCTLGLALTFALLLDTRGARATRFSRTSIFLPYAVPGVVASLLWGFMYLPGTSPFTWLSEHVGGGRIPFLDDPWVFGSVANIAIWGGVGFNMIIIYTSLRGIGPEIYDSARVDGANEWQIAWRIKVPLVAPALVLTGLFSLIGTLQVYGEPTTLRPMTSAISQTWVPLMTIYRDAFTRDDLPLAAAESVLLAVATVVLSVVLLRLNQRRTFGGR